MKTLVFFLLVITVPVLGQSVDYNKVILPDYTKTTDFGEKLVQLAWRNNPANEAIRRTVNVSEADVKLAGAQWLDIVSFTGNLNQFTLNPQSDVFGRSAYWPKYNVHASISLGQLVGIPASTKKAKEQLAISQANVNTQKLAIRNAVLKAYNEFLMREKVYKVQSQLLLDNETSHKLIEQRFKNGETNFETYSQSLSNYSTMTIGQMQAERDYKNAKLDLEQLIGMRLEDVR